MMPYKSEKQRKYLHAAKPEVAAKFDKHGKGAAAKKKAAARRKKK
jgi:hypothetical protein